MWSVLFDLIKHFSYSCSDARCVITCVKKELLRNNARMHVNRQIQCIRNANASFLWRMAFFSCLRLQTATPIQNHDMPKDACIRGQKEGRTNHVLFVNAIVSQSMRTVSDINWRKTVLPGWMRSRNRKCFGWSTGKMVYPLRLFLFIVYLIKFTKYI